MLTALILLPHMSIDRLRTAKHRRRNYVGPWLPEPVIEHAEDPTGIVATEDVSPWRSFMPRRTSVLSSDRMGDATGGDAHDPSQRGMA